MATLTSPQLKAALEAVPDWRKRGSSLRREFKFPDFAAAMKFVNAVARTAERANHHPDIDIRWNVVILTLSTHDEGGITGKDTDLAARIDSLAGKDTARAPGTRRLAGESKGSQSPASPRNKRRNSK